MLKKLLIGLLAIAAIIASIAARQGSTFAVERSIDIRATPGQVDRLTARLRVPGAFARIKPVAVASHSSLTLAATAGGTHVTWRISGPLSLRARLITAFIGIDILLGSDLEQGLAQVKAAAEQPARKPD